MRLGTPAMEARRICDDGLMCMCVVWDERWRINAWLWGKIMDEVGMLECHRHGFCADAPVNTWSVSCDHLTTAREVHWSSWNGNLMMHNLCMCTIRYGPSVYVPWQPTRIPPCRVAAGLHGPAEHI